MDNLREKILKEGENPAEKVIFAILNTTYEGQCYQVNPMPSEIERGVYEIISVNWRPSLNVSNLLSTIKVYITSRYNADGILQTYWLDGDNLDFTLDKHTYTEVGLEEVETVYLEEKTHCSTAEGMHTILHFLHPKVFFFIPISCSNITASVVTYPTYYRILLRLRNPKVAERFPIKQLHLYCYGH